MDKEKYDKKYSDHIDWRNDHYFYLAGKYQHRVSLLENTIGSFISNCYCGISIENRTLFWKTLLSKLSFEKKIQTFLGLLKEVQLINGEEHKTLKRDLEKIRRRRNLLAHSILYNIDEEILKYETHRVKLVSSADSSGVYLVFDEHIKLVNLTTKINSRIQELEDSYEEEYLGHLKSK